MTCQNLNSSLGLPAGVEDKRGRRATATEQCLPGPERLAGPAIRTYFISRVHFASVGNCAFSLSQLQLVPRSRHRGGRGRTSASLEIILAADGEAAALPLAGMVLSGVVLSGMVLLGMILVAM